jgi:hypothetical protein
MPFPLNIDQSQYEALVALARRGTSSPDELRELEKFLVSIETAHGITRHSLWVQWQELNRPLPAGTNFPTVWPPELRARIDLISRPVSRADVEALVRARAKQYVNIMVTRDPGAVLGWTKVDEFFRP